MRRIISLILLFIGMGCLLYPSISTYVNNLTHSETIELYDKTIEEGKDWSNELKKCENYNNSLINNPARFNIDNGWYDKYNNTVNITAGMMGYVEVPKIGIKLPIYHGTDELSLSNGVGHMFGTSIPIGEKNCHAVLSAHTGMADQAMFTDLTEMKIGDKFIVTILDKTLTYEIDDINTVLPTDMSLINIKKGEDYCTLITCVPYGINSHRLLVRGKCISSSAEEAKEIINKTDKVITKTEKVNILIILAFILILAFMIWSMTKSIKAEMEKRRREKDERRIHSI